MGTFGITRSRQRLGSAPATAVRSGQVATDVGTGGAIGQAAIGLAKIGIAIHQKRQQMSDANNTVLANANRDAGDQEFKQFMTVNPQEAWQNERNAISGRVDELNAKLKFTTAASQREAVKSKAYTQASDARALTAATMQQSKDTAEALTNSMTRAFASGDPAKIAEAVGAFTVNGSNMGKDAVEVQDDIIVAKVKGDTVRTNVAIGGVHAAIEAASNLLTGGDFTAAKELAKNPSIPEERQTSLRSAISTAEKAKSAQVKADEQRLKDETTSNTIREYYQGTMNVSELDKRHEAGLIKDSNYESMRKGLEANIPDVSDPFSRSTMNRAITQFKSGAMSRNDAQEAYLNNYEKLDESDRRKFGDSIEETFVAGQQNSIREAKSRGNALISPKFQSADPFGLAIFDEPEDQKRYDLEWRNRNMYEDALDDWVTQQTKDGKDLSPRDIRIRSNDLLIDYRKTKELDLDQFEAQLLGKEKAVKRTVPEKSKTLAELQKPANELTTAELQAEAKRLRERQ